MKIIDGIAFRLFPGSSAVPRQSDLRFTFTPAAGGFHLIECTLREPFALRRELSGNDAKVLGQAQAIHTPKDDDRPVRVAVRICDKIVPPAAGSMLGHCEYYYRPLHEEYVKKTGVSTWEAIKTWARSWNPHEDQEVLRRILRNRDKLILAHSTDGDWSRHASFMARHIGCEHRPPDYYVSYGYYYCSIYGAKLNPRLSVTGRKWLRDARLNLQVNMEDGLYDNMGSDTIEVTCKRYPNRTSRMRVERYGLEINNEVFKKFAFNSHVPAYLDAGLADLPLSDLASIGGQPNIEEWLDRNTWKQAVESGIEVGKEKTNQAADAVESALRSLVRHLSF
ncbi:MULTISPECIES: hypothetical protein [Cupriavidus]